MVSILMMNANLKIRKTTLLVLLGLPICFFLAAFNLIRTPAWSFDVIEYQIAYELINGLDSRSITDFIQLSFEPAFVFSSIATGYFTKSVNVVLFLFALASLIIKLVYIPSLYVKKNIILIATYTLTYYFLLELTQNRVAIASAIILLGYHFLVTNRRVWFVVTVIFASCFHYTAVIALLALLFDSQNGGRPIKRHLILFFMLFLLFLALKLPFAFSMIELLDPKKASYLSSADTELGTGPIRIAFVILYQALILIACRPSLLKLATPSVARFHELLFHLYVASISIYLTLHSFGVVAVRLAEVFRNLEPFLLVVTLSNCQKSKRPLLAFVIFVAVFVNLQKNSHFIYPLNWYLQAIGLVDSD